VLISLILVIFLSATVFAEETITAKLKSYNGTGKNSLLCNMLYGEIIREIDDFVLSRVYLDGTSEDFEPPQLTKNILNMNMIFAIGL